NDLMAWGVILGGGQAERRTVLQGENALHGALAEAAFAHDFGALVILQAARDDFRRAGAVDVDKDDHRHAVEFIPATIRAMDGVLRSILALSRNDEVASW